MWLLFALLTFFGWGGADLFYKIGADRTERYSHLKTAIVVGLVMGLAGTVTLLAGDIHYDWRNLLIYFPVSAAYILSMTVGYFGLRYLTVSVSSPIQNASGAVSAILLMAVTRKIPDLPTSAALILITVGVVVLGVFERNAERTASPEDKKHSVGFVAFFMPILYCVIDSVGTFLDGLYLDDVASTPLLGVTEDTLEEVANVSYQLTFLIAAVILAVYVYIIRKEKPRLKGNGSRLLAAGLEMGGQFAYVYALSGNGIVAAPVIASYCVASMFFGRVFLKEKLKAGQYLALALVVGGIVILGILEAVAE